jgi:hypothetical protein
VLKACLSSYGETAGATCWASFSEDRMLTQADYIIVGAGSSGCVLAAELSRDPAVTVALVESGPPDTSFLIDMPRGIGKLLTPGDPHCWQYEVNKGGNRPNEIWLKGRTLGGSSSINGMIYTVATRTTMTGGWPGAAPAGVGRTCCLASSQSRTTSLGRARCAVRVVP